MAAVRGQDFGPPAASAGEGARRERTRRRTTTKPTPAADDDDDDDDDDAHAPILVGCSPPLSMRRVKGRAADGKMSCCVR